MCPSVPGPKWAITSLVRNIARSLTFTRLVSTLGSVIISERDSINLIELQKLVDQWREGLQAFEKSLDQSDADSRHTLQAIQAKYNEWHKKLTTDFVYTDFTGSRRMHTPTTGTNGE